MSSLSFEYFKSSWQNKFLNVHVKPQLNVHVLRFTASSISWDEPNCSFSAIPYRTWWKDSFGLDERKFLKPSKNYSLPNISNIGVIRVWIQLGVESLTGLWVIVPVTCSLWKLNHDAAPAEQSSCCGCSVVLQQCLRLTLTAFAIAFGSPLFDCIAKSI